MESLLNGERAPIGVTDANLRFLTYLAAVAAFNARENPRVTKVSRRLQLLIGGRDSVFTHKRIICGYACLKGWARRCDIIAPLRT